MSGIPRALVAAALGIDEAALPPGDLPLDRLALRFLTYLRAGSDDAPAPADHPDAWCFALLDDLVRDQPDLALAATCAALAGCDSPEDVAIVAAGPLEDLIVLHGAALIDQIETLAKTVPRFAYALTGVWPRELKGSLLWARIEAARRDTPGLDDGAPLPDPDPLA